MGMNDGPSLEGVPKRVRHRLRLYLGNFGRKPAIKSKTESLGGVRQASFGGGSRNVKKLYGLSIPFTRSAKFGATIFQAMLPYLPKTMKFERNWFLYARSFQGLPQSI